MKIKLEDIIVTAVQSGGSGGEDRFTENVTLNFGKFDDRVPGPGRGRLEEGRHPGLLEHRQERARVRPSFRTCRPAGWFAGRSGGAGSDG